MLEYNESFKSHNYKFFVNHKNNIHKTKYIFKNFSKIYFFKFLIIYILLITSLFIYYKFKFILKEISNKSNHEKNDLLKTGKHKKKIEVPIFEYNNLNINNKISDNSYELKNIDKKITDNNDNTNIININYEVPDDENLKCKKFDPFKMFEKRFKYPKNFCKSSISNHICYRNTNLYFYKRNGVICKMNNVVIDPSKWRSSGLNYSLGPIDKKTRGFPLLSKGFFNIDCKSKKISSFPFNHEMYDRYINSWNYNYKSNEKYEELAPNKTVFFMSRNQDSPNLFWGGAGIINALTVIYYLNLKPENIQVVFLESMFLNKDPSYILYKNLISRGGEPIHIRNLTKKYHVSNSIHVPIMWDTPLTIRFSKVPICKYQSKAYHYLNQYVNKYINIPEFHDSKNFDSETFYYSKTVKDPNSPIYKKFLTFQWRKPWPKGRKGQVRILGNGPEIVEKLVEKLPKNILVRLVDTARFSMVEQISIIRKTDYFLGIHGAGLFLSAFMPTNSVLHEISTPRKTKNLLLVSSLSGHRTYCDIFNAKIKVIDNCEYQFYDPDKITLSVLNHMKEINFFN